MLTYAKYVIIYGVVDLRTFYNKLDVICSDILYIFI